MVKEYLETRVTKRIIETESFINDIVKVKDTFITTINGETTTKTKVIFTTLDNVEKVKGLEPISKKVYVPNIYQESANVCMIKKTDWEDLFKAKCHITEIVADLNMDIFNEDEYFLVLFDYGSNELLDLNKEYIPIPIHMSYDYSNGRMSNGRFNLQKVLNILKEHQDKIILGYDRFKREITELKVTSIPYYNAEEDNYEELSFWFVPNKDIFTKAQKLDIYEKSLYMFLETFNIKIEDILKGDKEC